ncbi:MAG: hypothetical protein KA712_21650 [Myxococcales bacterium]|nr:hypothetical protein [Myxococcales bacterium]
MTVAVIPAGGTEPVARFDDMDTALAWGLQRYKGKPFVVRVFTEDDAPPAEPESAPVAKRRRPATKAITSVLRAVDQEFLRAREGMQDEAGLPRKAAAQ